MGLSIGDNHGKFNYNTFANCSERLALLYASYTIVLSGPRSVSVRRYGKTYYVRVLGSAERFFREVAERCEKGFLPEDEELLWQFVAGLYEAGGCVEAIVPR